MPPDLSKQDPEWAQRRAEIEACFQGSWWTCGACHATYPRDYEPDYCANDCGPRLRKNDDIRWAIADA